MKRFIEGADRGRGTLFPTGRFLLSGANTMLWTVVGFVRDSPQGGIIEAAVLAFILAPTTR